MSNPLASASSAAPAPVPPALPIPRVSARSPASAEFLRRFVHANLPVIVEGALEDWRPPAQADTAAAERAREAAGAEPEAAAPAPLLSSSPPAEWSLPLLSSLLGSTLVRNVFVASSQHRRRFTFFKQPQAQREQQQPEQAATGSQPEAGTGAEAETRVASSAATSSSTTEASSTPYSASTSTSATPAPSPPQSAIAGLSRRAMPFDQFVRMASAAAREEQGGAAAGGKAGAGSTESDGSSFYLYGEPMPAPLLPLFPTPSILSAVSSSLTSTLLWVSASPTVSPLHFDLNEGILCQLHGRKRVTLAAPSEHSRLYPYPVQHPHDRQSRVDDIHQPDPTRFPLAAAVPLLVGDLDAGCLLYLPYGWWHQLEAETSSISVSMRWNPYEAQVRQLAAGAAATRSLPLPIRRSIHARLVDQSGLPQMVRDIHLRRWEEVAEGTADDGSADAIPAAAT